MNEEFQTKENGFNEIKKRIIIATIPLSIISAIAGVAISNLNRESSNTDMYTVLFLITLIIGAITFGLFKGIKRQRILFESYKLSFNEDKITRDQHNTDTISIPYSEITSIHKNSKGIITIHGNSAYDVIAIPSQIHNADKLEQLLADIQPIIHTNKTSFFIKYKDLLLVILTLSLMASVYISKNKIVVGITGTLLTVLLIYSVFKIQKNKNIDKKTKKSMWWIVLVLFSILGKMYLTLTGKI